MRLHDRLYGWVDVHEPVLIDLIQSAAVQRLRGVSQHGITGLIGICAPVSRFEHSVGVMLLVRRLGGSLDEQIAALLHDVSHTVFSHVIDHVFDTPGSQGYHDRVKVQYAAGTDLPDVLAAHGKDWHAYLREDDYPLLEQPAPALCADRLDYFLRDVIDLKLGTAADCTHALDHVINWDGRIVTDDLDVARWMAYTYIEADKASWANFREVGLYEVTAQALRLSFERGYLHESDLWDVDRAIWSRLHATGDADLQALLALVNTETGFVWDEAAPDFRIITKLRTIDPDVLINGALQPVSALDPAFAAYLADYLRDHSGAWPMRIVPPPGAEDTS
ncbi:MAG: HD domain-containing protein [Anaerolineae bacterium]|nr:HD domain-containing protein [Anaerolineae bacterium]